ncbi:MAG TPA: NADH-quinone oxidoreductase subunit K [Gaiellaceae bacterium]|nr:NADH-quinone oxidoreductase subunit K [Gaiellaceae bacterium]
MTLVFAGAIGILFGCGAFLMLKPDLFRVVVGMILISNAANLALMSSGLERGEAPIAPEPGETVSDALVQAMTLTAIVIGFGVTVLLLVLVYRIYTSHSTVDLDELSQAEARLEAELEREQVEV